MGASVLAHLGLGALLLSSAVPFLPRSEAISTLEEEFALVSIDVLDAVQVLEPENDLAETTSPEDDLAPLGGEESPSETPDLEALAPEDAVTGLEPEELADRLPENVDLPAEIPEVLGETTEEEALQEPAAVVPEATVAESLTDEDMPEDIAHSLADVLAPEESLPTEPVPADVLAVEALDTAESTPEIHTDFEDSFAVEDNEFDLAEDSPLEGEGAGGFDTALSLTPDEVSLPSDNLAETLEPLGGQEAEEVALLSPQEVGQSEESGPTSGEPEPEPEVVGVGPEFDAATETPPQRTAQRIATPSGQMRGLGQLIRQIRAVPQPQCSLLLPRRSQSAGLGLSMVGTDDIVLNAAADRVVARVDSAVQRNLEIIDLRQCAALDALRQSAAYPASRLGLALEQRTLNSGDRLRARVIGAGGLNLALLLVDDNGVVQDLSRFATLEGDAVVIDAPVARAGALRNTRQMFFVLGHENEGFDLEAEMGKTAQDVFSSLSGDILQDAVFAMTTFQVLQ
ncbi:hypothetical protein TRM7557_01740 [Tritonibacter multivorans]|uniref:Uncharacterized protein n=1 Tax=Tritonibacter multivorans TaxID=928856 RepID=A0A0P1G9G0_9RHOB|nr:hypothetical protein [Tritonibacter multivorans]MDA7422938.1 hypothetical protein [Tritonibacter multivorans]CUH78136.1 hypothetical protein TRM7557_01740 [Tritonibacter multivorans]SFD75030.1 hypothetical protein SAMN04488049_1267 [Tritonibacter multivorans]